MMKDFSLLTELSVLAGRFQMTAVSIAISLIAVWPTPSFIKEIVILETIYLPVRATAAAIWFFILITTLKAGKEAELVGESRTFAGFFIAGLFLAFFARVIWA